MKNEKLSADEYDALNEVARGIKGDRVSACVGRNTKRLSGLKLFNVARNGQITLTEKGQQALFLRRCILGLRAVAAGGDVKLDTDVANFLGKKAHIQAREGGYDITDKGRESLADIEAQGH
jgi:predicted transcriptional regulator